MLIDLLASPGVAALANVIQIGTFLGVGWTIYAIYRDRQPITVVVRCGDGRKKMVGRIPRRFVTRAEIAGCISMKAGQQRLDFTKFDPDYKFRDQTVIVDLTSEDFERVQAPEAAA